MPHTAKKSKISKKTKAKPISEKKHISKNTQNNTNNILQTF